MLTTITLVVASLVIGFTWGFVLTVHKFVFPLQKRLREERELTIKFLDEQTAQLMGILGKVNTPKDGPVLSPLQIKRD